MTQERPNIVTGTVGKALGGAAGGVIAAFDALRGEVL